MRLILIILFVCYHAYSHSYKTSKDINTYTTYMIYNSKLSHILFVASSPKGILYAGIQGKDSQNCVLEKTKPLKNGTLKCGVYSFKVKNGKLEKKYNLTLQESFTLQQQKSVYEYPLQQGKPISTITTSFQCSDDINIQGLIELMYQKKFTCQNGKDLFYKDAENSMQTYIKNADIEHQTVESFLEYNPLEEIVEDSLVYFDQKLLVFEKNGYLYTGGAHGISEKWGVVLSRSEGLINLNEKINLNSQRLKTELWKKYQQYLKDTSYSATEPYIDFEDFKVSDSILLDYDGVIFVYQPYEIAPYAAGIIELKLPLKHFEKFENFSDFPPLHHLFERNTHTTKGY
ncbi:MAG: DUF3298 and DUF4163 domain-containing protein [Helicobacter sp.]|nr:DUF3298 and DUF4163 domain-containing protein [Helicobacter sp.]